MLEAAREEEQNRIINLLKEERIYTPGLEPLIENYLDAAMIYKNVLSQWEDEAFAPTKTHENKAGAINVVKNPLAQQVEVWSDKKNKMLDMLGLTNKNKPKSANNAKNIAENEPKDELAKHRTKWRNSG